MNIKVIVAVKNSNGESDIWACKVGCNEDQYNAGDHYDAAKDAAAELGYEPYLAYDEHDPGFKSFKIDWHGAEVLKI